jgi:hypothetical protein
MELRWLKNSSVFQLTRNNGTTRPVIGSKQRTIRTDSSRTIAIRAIKDNKATKEQQQTTRTTRQ